MAPKTRFYKAKSRIESFFQNTSIRVFSESDLSLILEKHKVDWNLPIQYSLNTFINDLIDHLKIKRINISSRNIFEYKIADDFDIFQKLKPNIFYSHYSALRFHDLTEQTPFKVYLSKARKNTIRIEDIDQISIDIAFSKKKEKSNTPLLYGNYKIYLHTMVCEENDLETKKINTDEYAFFIKLTNLEKTLIDSVINPDLCGGPAEVLKAFSRAKEKISSIKIVSILKKLNYKYPYHQAIGFYMEQAGYDNKKLIPLENMEVINSFYLTHSENYMYNPRWKIYFPNSL